MRTSAIVTIGALAALASAAGAGGAGGPHGEPARATTGWYTKDVGADAGVRIYASGRRVRIAQIDGLGRARCAGGARTQEVTSGAPLEARLTDAGAFSVSRRTGRGGDRVRTTVEGRLAGTRITGVLTSESTLGGRSPVVCRARIPFTATLTWAQEATLTGTTSQGRTITLTTGTLPATRIGDGARMDGRDLREARVERVGGGIAVTCEDGTTRDETFEAAGGPLGPGVIHRMLRTNGELIVRGAIDGTRASGRVSFDLTYFDENDNELNCYSGRVTFTARLPSP